MARDFDRVVLLAEQYTFGRLIQSVSNDIENLLFLLRAEQLDLSDRNMFLLFMQFAHPEELIPVIEALSYANASDYYYKAIEEDTGRVITGGNLLPSKVLDSADRNEIATNFNCYMDLLEE